MTRMTEDEYGTRVEEIDQHVNDGLITEDEGRAKRRALRKQRGVEIFVAMNEDGDVAVSDDCGGDASQRLTENCGGIAIRVASFTIHMMPPAVESGPAVTIPDSAGTTEQIEVEAE
jgi:hypothetical protein